MAPTASSASVVQGRPGFKTLAREEGSPRSSGMASTSMLLGGLRQLGTTYFQPETGGPQSILAIIDGECHDLGLVAGGAEHGAFEATLSLEPGCHRYYFYARDGPGQRPCLSHDRLARRVCTARVKIVLSSRPVAPQTHALLLASHVRQEILALATPGPYGTEGRGICESGVERCVGGIWAGECRLQVKPQESEVCGDGLDNDCDGEVDAGCPSTEDGAPGPQGDDTDGSTLTIDSPSDEGCAQSAPHTAPLSPLLLAFFGLLIGLRQRLTASR